jgi:outer membrane protein assembly factor BamB
MIPKMSEPRNAPSTRRTLLKSLLLLLVSLLLGPPTSAESDAPWPRYRGPAGDGHSSETGLLLDWPAGGPKKLWQTELGYGYSGMSVARGNVFTLYSTRDDEVVIALAEDTGKEAWRYRIDTNRYDSQGSGPRSTPTVDGDAVYVLGAAGKLFALAADTGEVRWGVNLVARLGARIPRWGASTSPVIDGDLLLLDVGGRDGYSLVALEKKTGEVRWHSQTDKAGYSTPLVIDVAGQRQALFFTGSALVSVSPEDGRFFWRFPWRTSYDVNAAMPVFLPPDRVFISSGYDSGAAVLKIVSDGEGVGFEEVWRSRRMKNHFNSSILVGSHIYGFDNAILKCIEAATGEERWAARGFSKGSLLYADGHLIIFGERGLLAVAEASPDGYRERARTQVFNAKTWTMPTLANGRLFLRSEKEMVALDLRR